MSAILTRSRLARLGQFASAQVIVQGLGFLAGILLVRQMEPTQYAYYTLTMTLVGVGNVLTELGIVNATLAIGGRMIGDGQSLDALLADAKAFHLRLSIGATVVVIPLFVGLLRHQHADWAFSATLALISAATTWYSVRALLVVSVARLRGALSTQQRVDVSLNAARLALIAMCALWFLNAVVAAAINLVAAAATFWVWRRWLGRGGYRPEQGTGEHWGALGRNVRRQAPNSLYYVINGQLAIWLVSVFGSTDRVAQVGALGRLSAIFMVVASVVAGVIQPYFSRARSSRALKDAFLAVNGFFALTLVVMVTAAITVPGLLLWILGGHYAALRAELLWMVLSTTLASWAGTLYGLGSGRGWIVPASLGIGTGVASTIVGVLCFDVSSVAGNFELSTLSNAVSTVVIIAFMRRHLAQAATSADAGSEA